jgi:signal transduction histidine kinase
MIHVALRITAEQVTLEIADDGRGFNATAGVQQGLGLRMIRYRTRLMRGTLQIDQPPAGGTRIIVGVPYGNS